LQRWREDTAYQPIPVIVMTASGQAINPDELGVQAIFTKPFDLDRLLARLTQLLA
jgi:DNA-binding response OmpR family regulator